MNKEFKVTALDLMSLDAELNGIKNEQTGEVQVKGLLQEALSMQTKYHLSKLGKQVATEKAELELLRNEAIKKFGVEGEDGGVSIPYQIDGEPNPAAAEFSKEMEELYKEEITVMSKGFSLEEFKTVITDTNFTVFFTFIEDGKQG